MGSKMVKYATIAITNKCNSRCTMCNIWKTGITPTEINAEQFGDLFKQDYFKEIIDASISGGEPVLRKDAIDVVKSIIDNLPALKHLWVNSNGTYPKRVLALLESVYGKIENEYLCLSIEGRPEDMHKVRGINCYDSVIQTAKLIREQLPKINVVFSTTITPHNSNIANLEHVAELASKYGCTYTFRFANNNDDFYHNSDVNLCIPEEDVTTIMDFSRKFKADDKFIAAQHNFFKTGQIDVMDNCLAGSEFVFVRPDGTMTPCINSGRVISKPMVIKDLGTKEKCPCCTECCFYPMLSHKQSKQK